jgi:bifunctional enzyme CysN/CysC
MRTDFDAHLVWMDGQALDLNRPYLIRHTSRTVRVKVAEILHRVDVATLDHVAADKLQLNEIAKVRIKAAQALFLDPYPEFRRTGCFVLVDPLSNATVAAGMIAAQQPSEAELAVHLPRVDRPARQAQSGHRAGVLWLRGGPAVLQAEAAQQLEARLFQRGAHVLVLDDAALQPLEADLAGDQHEERSRRLAVLAGLLVRSGHLVIVASDMRGTQLQTHVSAEDLLILDLGDLADAESGAATALKLATDTGWLGAAGVVSIGAGI